MNRLEKLFGGAAVTFDEFSAAAKEAGFLVLEGDEGSYVPASREAELLGELEKAREDYKRDVSRLRAEGAVREALIKSGAHNPDVALRAVDISAVGGDEAGVYLAAETAVSALRSAEPYLFRAEGVTVSTGAAHGTSVPDTEQMSDVEYYRHINLK